MSIGKRLREILIRDNIMNFDLDSYTELVPGSAKIISREKHPGTWSQDENGEIVFYDFEKKQ